MTCGSLVIGSRENGVYIKEETRVFGAWDEKDEDWRNAQLQLSHDSEESLFVDSCSSFFGSL